MKVSVLGSGFILIIMHPLLLISKISVSSISTLKWDILSNHLINYWEFSLLQAPMHFLSITRD